MENNNSGFIFDILTQILGEPKTHYATKGQASWNCPVCDMGRNKSNFEVNYYKDVYQCWSCGESEGTHGSIYKLIKIWGNKQQLSNYLLLRPDVIKKKVINEEDLKIFTGLPEGYTKFSEDNPESIYYKQAHNYLIKERGITDEIINKYDIGYTVKGKFHHRIIIPSYGPDGEVNYFSARSYVGAKRKYDNPEAPKEKIIFNEYFVDWDKDIFLVEGAFDHIVVPNSITMLGKKMSDLLWETLYDKATADIIIAYDPDAMDSIKKLYKQLDGGKLKGHVKALFYKSEYDLCDLHKRLSPDDFQKLLQSARQIKESKL